MNSFALFTDGSFDPNRKLGLGAYFIAPESYLAISPEEVDKSLVAEQLVFREFTETSSTRLEVQTALWALESCRCQLDDAKSPKLRIYSDSQCVCGLLDRRRKLEARNFVGAKTDRPLKNALVYRRYFALYDELHFEVVKVAGHQRSSSHDSVHRIFSLVDRGVRRALKLALSELS